MVLLRPAAAMVLKAEAVKMTWMDAEAGYALVMKGREFCLRQSKISWATVAGLP